MVDAAAITDEARKYADQGAAIAQQFGLSPADAQNDPGKLVGAAFEGAGEGLGIASTVVVPLASAFAWCPPCAAAILAYGSAAAALAGAIAKFFMLFSFTPHYTQAQKDLEVAGEKLSSEITRILLTVPEPGRSTLALLAWKAMGSGNPLALGGYAGGWPIFLPAASGFWKGPSFIVKGVDTGMVDPNWPGIQGYKGAGYVGSTSMAGMAAANKAIAANIAALAQSVANDPVGTAVAMGTPVPPGTQIAPLTSGDVSSLPDVQASTSFFTPRRVAVGVGLGVLGWFGLKATKKKGSGS